ncbi:MAG: DUF4249 domain-containing protein [Prevotellaceae bacterium]|nr:DUF4249 domain-containing protein [Prevotellaceae bacterium]
MKKQLFLRPDSRPVTAAAGGLKPRLRLRYLQWVVLLAAACQPTLVAEFEDRPVVACYLYAGEPVAVTVSKLIAFRDDVAFASDDVNNLVLTVTDMSTGAAHALTPQGAGGRYTSDAFLPEAGHSYQLQFLYDNVPVTAVTQIAAVPQNVAFSKTAVAGGGGGMGGAGGMPEPIEITFDNPDGDYYMVVAACATLNPTPVFEAEEGEEAPDFPLSFQTEPTQGEAIELTSQLFSYYGKYTVRLCRIQPEYLAFCRSMSIQKVTLRELHANVENGFGIFTGISSVSAAVYVVSN